VPQIDPKQCLVVICGDLNSGREESVWQLLTRGRIEGGTTDVRLPGVEVTRTTVSHMYRLRDVYNACGFDLPYTRKVPTLGAVIDYVFASRDFDVVALHYPLAVRLTDEAGLRRLSLPNGTHPSDHLPVGCVLRLRQPSKAALRAYAKDEAQAAAAASAEPLQ